MGRNYNKDTVYELDALIEITKMIPIEEDDIIRSINLMIER